MDLDLNKGERLAGEECEEEREGEESEGDLSLTRFATGDRDLETDGDRERARFFEISKVDAI